MTQRLVEVLRPREGLTGALVSARATSDLRSLEGPAALSGFLALLPRARFLRWASDGAQLWRAARPGRFLLLVLERGGERVVERVLEERRSNVPPASRRRQVTLRVEGRPVSLDVEEAFYEPGEGRRVAFRLAAGDFVEFVRGDRAGEVVGELRSTELPPEWALARGAFGG